MSHDPNGDGWTCIVEAGEIRPVTTGQADALEAAGVVFLCDDPDCAGQYHLLCGRSWADVDAALEELS